MMRAALRLAALVVLVAAGNVLTVRNRSGGPVEVLRLRPGEPRPPPRSDPDDAARGGGVELEGGDELALSCEPGDRVLFTTLIDDDDADDADGGGGGGDGDARAPVVELVAQYAQRSEADVTVTVLFAEAPEPAIVLEARHTAAERAAAAAYEEGVAALFGAPPAAPADGGAAAPCLLYTSPSPRD